MHSFKLMFSCLLSSLLYVTVQGQAYEISNSIPVRMNGTDLKAAWAGGLNSPQFSAMDLDGDGTEDLVVFDRYDDELLTFLNGGTPNFPDYHYAPEYERFFPGDLVEWVLMRDYNGDGHMDIFTALSAGSNIRVFRNNAPNNGGQIQFVLEKDTLSTLYPPLRKLYAPRTDIPSIEDMDGDGDLDILSFDVGGSFVEFHRNTSMETNGNLNGLDYEVASICYGHFRESSSGCAPTIGLAPCQAGNRLPGGDLQRAAGARHAGSTLLSLDLNGDSELDLLVGDISCTYLYAMFGSDTSSVAHFDSLEVYYPLYDISVDIPFFPSIFYLDVDNDGVKDMLNAPNQTGNVEDKAGVWWYKNVGTNNFPQFQREGLGFLQSEMIEIGSGSVPLMFDFNADGRLDLLVGGLGRIDSMGGYRPGMHLFENTGTATNAAFELVDEDYLGLGSLAQFAGKDYFAPTLGDLDGDGDNDMLIGDRDGGLHYFRNDGGAGSPVNFTFVTSNFSNINADLFTHPCLYDLDADGDQDLLIGNIRGDIHYYENTGSPSSPNFTFVTGSFGGIEITDFSGQSFTNGFARPLVLDYDGDGDLEVLVGTIEGPVEIYEGFSLQTGANFNYAGDLMGTDFGRYTCVAAGMIDTTGAFAYMVGGYRGGLKLLTFTGTVDAEEEVDAPLASMLAYPNPLQDELTIRIEGMKGGLFEVLVVDVMGRRVAEKGFRGTGTELDVSGWAVGMYTVVVRRGRESWTAKVVKR